MHKHFKEGITPCKVHTKCSDWNRNQQNGWLPLRKGSNNKGFYYFVFTLLPKSSPIVLKARVTDTGSWERKVWWVRSKREKDSSSSSSPSPFLPTLVPRTLLETTGDESALVKFQDTKAIFNDWKTETEKNLKTYFKWRSVLQRGKTAVSRYNKKLH